MAGAKAIFVGAAVSLCVALGAPPAFAAILYVFEPTLVAPNGFTATLSVELVRWEINVWQQYPYHPKLRVTYCFDI